MCAWVGECAYVSSTELCSPPGLTVLHYSSLLLQMENSGVIHMLKTSKTEGEKVVTASCTCMHMHASL